MNVPQTCYVSVQYSVIVITESHCFNFYFQIWKLMILKFQNIHRYVVGMFSTKYACSMYQMLTYCT